MRVGTGVEGQDDDFSLIDISDHSIDPLKSNILALWSKFPNFIFILLEVFVKFNLAKSVEYSK